MNNLRKLNLLEQSIDCSTLRIWRFNSVFMYICTERYQQKKSPILLTEKLFCLVSELTPRSNKRPVFVCCNFSRPLSSLPVNICSASCAGVLRVHVTFLSSLVVLDHFNAAGNYDRGIPKIKQITE